LSSRPVYRVVYEVELKIRTAHGPVRERLAELDVTEGPTVTQTDTYYDAPHREFAETDEALRLRDQTDAEETTTKLTYKGPLVDTESKTRREAETVVGDAQATETVLEGVGFEPAAVVEKTRTYFEHDGYTVVLDEVTGLGEFVEVEREAETVEPAREGARRLLRELGLDPDEQVRTSYLGLLLDAQE
jgi:adenylate cyclase class 2